ncbi:MAG: hypothetical protein ACFNS6_03115 [Candidatus Saccharimonas sp.]
MYKKIALFVLATIIATTSLTAMINESAFAAPELSEPYFPAALVERAKKKSAANIYLYCAHKNSDPRTSSASDPGYTPGSDPGNQVVFNKNKGVAKGDILGYGWGGSASGGASDFNSEGDNNQNCGSLSITTFVNFFNSIGFNGSDPQEILCNMGSNVVIYSTFESKSTKEQCDKDKRMEGTTITVKLEAFEAIIRVKVEDFDNVDRFYTAYTLVKRYCNVTNQGTDVSKITETNYPIFFADKTGEGDTYRHTTDKANDSFYTWNDMTNYTQGSAQCNNIMNKYIGYQNHNPKQPWVDDYVAYLKALYAAEKKSKSGTTTPSTPASGTKEYAEACKNLGYSSGKELEACAEGFKNASDPNFCSSKYSSSPTELAACQAAQNSLKAAPPPEEKEEDQENCKIDYVGWIVCPVVNILAQMSDEAQEQLEKFLVVNNNDIRDNAYEYWTKIRDYANIIFVIAFLYVIYSQLTGYGIDNYGIKRMLPKLIMGIILVNVSFHLCLLLIDISNVVGSSAYKFISSVEISGGADAPSGSWVSKGNWATGIAALALGATIGFFALSAVIAGLVFILIVALTTVFMLGLRQAILILCVVISPLAFAAMLLPNVESLFKKWWSAFKACLFLYPIVGILFGASSLAASILSKGSDGDVVKQLLVALLQIAPLLLVKKLIDAAMNIGGLSSVIGKMQGKVRGFVNDKAQSRLSKGLYGQWRGHRDEKNKLRRAQIQGGTYRGKWGAVNPRNWRSGANRRINAVTGEFGQKRKLGGSAAALAEDNERMKAANAWIADNNMSSDRLAEIATGFTRDKDGNKVAVDLSGISSYQRRAAMQALAPHMTSEQAANLATASASFGDASLQKEAANAIAQSGAKKAPWLGGKQLEAIQQGTYNEQEAMRDYIQNKASGQGLANADAKGVEKMVDFAENEARHNADNSYMRSLMRARADLEADPKTAGGVSSAVRQQIERIPPMQRQSNSGGGQGGSGGGGRNQGGGGGQGDGN